jgi:hypothetical protein
MTGNDVPLSVAMICRSWTSRRPPLRRFRSFREEPPEEPSEGYAEPDSFETRTPMSGVTLDLAH